MITISHTKVSFEEVKFKVPLKLGMGRDILGIRERTIVLVAQERSTSRTGTGNIFDSVLWANPTHLNPEAIHELDLLYLQSVSSMLAVDLSDRLCTSPFEIDEFLEQKETAYRRDFEEKHGYTIEPLLPKLLLAPFSMAAYSLYCDLRKLDSFIAKLPSHALWPRFLDFLSRALPGNCRLTANYVEKYLCKRQLEKSSYPRMMTVGRGVPIEDIEFELRTHQDLQLKLKIDPTPECSEATKTFLQKLSRRPQRSAIYLDANQSFKSLDQLTAFLQSVEEIVTKSPIHILGIEEPTSTPFDETIERIESYPYRLLLDENLRDVITAVNAAKYGYGFTLKLSRPISTALIQLLLGASAGVPLAVQDLTFTGSAYWANRSFRKLIDSDIGLESNARQFLQEDWLSRRNATKSYEVT